MLDLQGFQSGPARALNSSLRWFFRWYANWNADEDIPGAIEAVFGEFDLLDAYALGAVYTGKAT